jgi:hypothetical protein
MTTFSLADLECLLETGRTASGKPATSEMLIAMQDLLEPDPWMHEPLTEEEKKVFANPNPPDLVEWK